MGSKIEKIMEGVGVCEKTLDGLVSFQNSKCQNICGNKLGRKCEMGCMKQYSQMNVDSSFRQGFIHLRNVGPEGKYVDATIVENGNSLTTFLYDKSDVVKFQLRAVEEYGLTKSEKTILSDSLGGLSNREVAAKFFISRATLRTHLNNIYKKLPENIKNSVLVSHLGRFIKFD